MIEVSYDLAKSLLPQRFEDSNKSTYGKVLSIAGAVGTSGAGYFCAKSVLKIGAGYSILATDKKLFPIYSVLSPDLVLMEKKKVFNRIGEFDSINVGCGIGISQKNINFIKKLLKSCKVPLVIDADGINCLAKVEKLRLSENVILTPHPLELSRLLKVEKEDVIRNPENYAIETAKKYACIVVLKSSKTIIASSSGEVFRNVVSSSALSVAGSGDVLTGIISGLLGQGLKPVDAAVLGVYIHSIAGKIVGEKFTEYSSMASDIMDTIADAIRTLI